MKTAGNKIRDARIAKDMSIDELHLRTKISIVILKSIEHGDDPGLPAPHLRGFLRSIADELDIDPDDLIKSAGLETLRLNVTDTDSYAEKKLSRGLLKFVTSSSVIGLFIVVVLFAVVYFKYLKHDFKESRNISLLLTASDSVSTEKTFPEVLADSMLFQNKIRQVISKNEDKKLSDSDTLVRKMEIKEDSLYVRGIARTVLTGSVTPDEIESVVKDFKALVRNSKQNTSFLEALEQLNPRINIVAFFGSWNRTSLKTIAKLVATLNEAYVPGVSLSIVGVNEDLHDSAGLAELHNVRAVPTVIFLSRGTELGRIVLKDGEYESGSVENEFLKIAQKAEIYIKAEIDE